MIKKIVRIIKEYMKRGLFHIFFSNVFSQVCGLISSIVVIRYLPKGDYGSYVGAYNLYSYISIFIGLGFSSAILQYCSENISNEQKNSIYKYGLKTGSTFNIVLIMLIVILGIIKGIKGDSEQGNYLILMALYPLIIYINAFFQTVLRIRGENQVYSYVNILYALLIVFGNIVFTRIMGVKGLICATYVAHAIVSIYEIRYLWNKGFIQEVQKNKVILDAGYKKEIKKYSMLCAVTNFTSSLLVLLDITCLDAVLASTEILADYKVASTIPTACMFVPTALITFFYPQMVNAYSRRIGFKEYIQKLLAVFIVINLSISIILFVSAPLVVSLVYGDRYKNVVPIFRILLINYFLFASFRKPLGNIIAVIKKVNVNLLHTVLAGGLNIFLNIFLIMRYGSIGAAVATVLVSIFIVVLEISYLGKFVKNM